MVTGQGRKTAVRAVLDVLKQHFKVGKDILIFESTDKEIKRFEFFLRKSPKASVIVTNIGDIPFDRDYFGGEKEEIKNTLKLVETLPAQTNLILNFDDETVREIDDLTNLNTLSFGFQLGADFKASDVKFNGGTNFKVNYKGNVVPVWLEKIFGKEQIYSALCATAMATVLGLNLVETSQSLKNYHSLPGKMKLIKGIKNSWILDDTESATVFSMIEALEILGKLKNFKRKIAVLGDIIGIGKYTIEAHESIGEKVIENADFLFTFGSRARFISKGAEVKGMANEKISSFNTIEQGVSDLRKEIKEGDLILVDGSKDMQMKEIVEKIKFRQKKGNTN